MLRGSREGYIWYKCKEKVEKCIQCIEEHYIGTCDEMPEKKNDYEGDEEEETEGQRRTYSEIAREQQGNMTPQTPTPRHTLQETTRK